MRKLNLKSSNLTKAILLANDRLEDEVMISKIQEIEESDLIDSDAFIRKLKEFQEK